MRRSGWLALAVALTGASGPAVGDPVVAAETEELRFFDAVPGRPSVAERLDEIRRRIQAALVYPPLARRNNVEGVALLRFEIGRDGEARELRLVRTSGKPSLDRAATRAVVAAAPLPWVYGRVEVPVRFELEGSRGMAAR
jgi:TonB family protein